MGSTELIKINEDKNKKPAYKGDLFIAIDISKFAEIDFFKSRVSNLIKDMDYIPGKRAYKNKDKEIEIDDKLYGEIRNF